jgi:branched-chain amino acid transport system ATP-binding protein
MSVATSGARATEPENRPTPVLEVSDLTSGYGRTMILRDVNLTVARNSVTALIGPNGAGKTTLLSTISGLITPERGRVTLNGVDVTKRPAHLRARRGLCHIPQGRGIYPALTVRENLVMQSPKGQERESVEKATTVFPVLGSRISQRAGTLSGGEQQMLSMASAYLRAADVILVDEASLGLAPKLIDMIFESLTTLAAQGTALLLVDQFVSRVLEMADQAYVLSRGELVFAGTPTELRGKDIFEYYVGA